MVHQKYIFSYESTHSIFPLLSCMQDSVRIRTEVGPSLLISPKKRYSEDFEPYESADMEVG